MNRLRTSGSIFGYRPAKPHTTITRVCSESWYFLRLRMSSYEPSSRHLQDRLAFCSKAKIYGVEAHLLVSSTYAEDAFHKPGSREWIFASKTVDYTLKTRIVVAERNVLKIQNWRNYLMKFHVKGNKDQHMHYMWHKNLFQSVLQSWACFRRMATVYHLS